MSLPATGGRHTGALSWLTKLLPWPVALALVLLLQAGAGVFLVRLHINNAPEAYYPQALPAIQLRDALRREFPGDELLTLVFRGADLYEPATLRRFDDLRQRLEREALVDRVFTVTSMEHIGGTEDGFAVGPLVAVDQLAGRDAAAIRQEVLADRFAPGLLAARDGRYMAVAVRPKPLSDSGQRQAVRAAALAAIDAVGLRDAYVGDAGPLTLDVVQLDAMLADTLVFVPLTVTIGIALMWWLVGAVRPVVIGSLAMSTVVAPAVALIPAVGAPYTMVAAILPSLLSAYTMATLMHFYSAVQRAQAGGRDQASSVALALQETREPGAFNVLTTGAGLLSLLLVPIPPIQVFGAVGAAGTAMVYLVVFVLVPPLLVRWDRAPWPQRRSGMSLLGRLSTRLTIFSLRHPVAILGAAAVVSLAVLPLVQRVNVEANLLAYFAPDHPVNEVTRIVDARFVGVTALEISLSGDGRDAFKDAGRLRAVREFQRWLESQPEVDRTLSMADLVQEMHWAMNGEKPAFRVVPPDQRLISQYLFVYDGEDLYELVNREFQRARVMVNLNVHGSREIGAVLERIRARVAAQPIPGVEVDIGGHGRLFSDQADLLIEGQLKSFAGAFVQIFLLMALAWRTFKGAGVCMIPNLAPLLFVFALMGATGRNLDMATVMIASVIIGITVDDTIHLFHGLRRRRANGIGVIFAIARSFQVSGRAVLATSVLLISQFLLLGMSGFIPTANFGLLTAVGLIAGQAFELLLLPALLMVAFGKARRRGAKRRVRAVTGSDEARQRPSDLADTVLLDRDIAGPAPASRADGVCAAASRDNRVLICLGSRCRQAGAIPVWAAVKRAGRRVGLAGPGGRILLTKTGCLGPCDEGPVVQTFPVGAYRLNVSPEQAVRMLLTLKRPSAPGPNGEG